MGYGIDNVPLLFNKIKEAELKKIEKEYAKTTPNNSLSEQSLENVLI